MEQSLQNVKDSTKKNSSGENNTAQKPNQDSSSVNVFNSAFGNLMKKNIQGHMQKLTKINTKLPNNDNKDIMTK